MEKAIYFMPDISGFSKFVNHTEIEHSIHIIAELLEILLDNIIIDLQLVEIEGDALFMYTTKIPTFAMLNKQTTVMLEAFHDHTQNYENKRICECGSCRTTTNLKLKFLVHFGDLNFIKVKHIVKPYGSEVIKIHRLLKNNVPLNEYILFTNSVYELYKNEIDEAWKKNTEIYDLNSLDYFYKDLDGLKTNLSLETPKNDQSNFKNDSPILTIKNVFQSNAQDIYTYVSELKYRHLWDKEVKRIEFDQSKVNRVGTEHNCILNLGSLKFKTITEPTSNSLVYGEQTKGLMFTKNYSYLIKLIKLDEHTTKVTLDIYITFSTMGKFMQHSILKTVSKMWKLKLEELERLSKNKIQP